MCRLTSDWIWGILHRIRFCLSLFSRAKVISPLGAILLLFLQACTQPTPTSTPVRVYQDALIIGRLVMQEGCLRLQTGRESVQLVWPETYTVTVRGQTVFIDGLLGSITLTLGQQVSMGGGALSSNAVIQNLRARGLIPPQCDGPYWEVGLEITSHLRIDGVLEKKGRCWRLRAEDGTVYGLMWMGGLSKRETEREVTFGVYEERTGEMVFVPRVTFRVGERVHVEGALYPSQWRGGNVPRECPGPYLVVDTIRTVEKR